MNSKPRRRASPKSSDSDKSDCRLRRTTPSFAACDGATIAAGKIVKWLSDATLDRLREIADLPDLSGTKYEIVDKIDQGGMGTVYRVLDRHLNREVALKVLRSPGNPEARRRILDEARIIARLEHPGMIPVHDWGELPDGRVYYVMKLVQGLRLDDPAVRRKSTGELLRIFQSICQAVSFAHSQGVIHRDLKPPNIMVGAYGEVLVLDWGVAKVVSNRGSVVTDPLSANLQRQDPGEVRHTEDGTRIGTIGYMAPEQARGEVEELDEQTDVYALGAILRFLFSHGEGRPAPTALRAVWEKAAAREKRDRYGDVGELSEEVSRYLAGLPVQARRESYREAAIRLASKYRTPLLLVLSYLIMRIPLIFWLGR